MRFYLGYYSYYWLILLGSLIMLWAQMKVQGAYSKYRRISSSSGLTGYDVARRILDQNGLYDVEIYQVKGELSDHYDPRQRSVNLSGDIYHGHSIASIAVAAHECGHAIQHKEGYRSLVYRNALIPVFNVSQSIGWVVLMIGFLSGAMNIALIGVILLSAMLLFQILTLPIEFNASNRALAILDSGMIPADEVSGAKKMLNAAALTYVAAVASSLLSILRLLLIIFSNQRRD